MEQTSHKKRGSLVTALVVIIIVILGFFLLNKPKVSVAPIPEDGVNQEELENLDNMEDQSELSEEDDIETIDSELSATSFSELEADLDAFEF